MEYMPSTVRQAVGLLYSAGLGFCLGILYDLFRMLFYLLTGSDKKLSVPRDIIYLFVCLCMTFVFLLVMCDGRLMFYAAAGIVTGVMIYFYSVGDIVYQPVKRFLKKIRRLFSSVASKITEINVKFSALIQKSKKKLDK